MMVSLRDSSSPMRRAHEHRQQATMKKHRSNCYDCFLNAMLR
jgi:hypothetical protein